MEKRVITRPGLRESASRKRKLPADEFEKFSMPRFLRRFGLKGADQAVLQAVHYPTRRLESGDKRDVALMLRHVGGSIEGKGVVWADEIRIRPQEILSEYTDEKGNYFIMTERNQLFMVKRGSPQIKKSLMRVDLHRPGDEL